MVGLKRTISAKCENCGKERLVVISGGHTPSRLCRRCGAIRCWHNHPERLRGPANPAWKGGRHSRGEYIVRTLEPSDFFYSMADKKGRVYEHRLVMARHLKRCLLPWEVVHHGPGGKTDNRLENLKLLPTIKTHLPDMVMKRHVKRLKQRIEQLEAMVTLLEAENELLRVGKAQQVMSL